jgi:serpin B
MVVPYHGSFKSESERAYSQVHSNHPTEQAMRKGWWGFAVGLLFSCMAQGQQSVPATPNIVASNTKFAFKMLRLLSNQTPEHNVLVAPTGLSRTFALLANGSDFQTQQEIKSTFDFGEMSLDQINEGFAGLRERMFLDRPLPPKPPGPRNTHHQAPPPIGLGYNPNGLVVADSLWGSEHFSAPFRELCQKYYAVDLEKSQLASELSAQVSWWASRKIQKEVPMSLGAMAKNDFVLVDVTRFHSFWHEPFAASLTKPTPFTLVNGQEKSVPMMYRTSEFNYVEDPTFQGIQLRYREDFSLYVLLPGKQSSVKDLEQRLAADSWRDLLTQFRSRPGFLGLPKFRTETGFDVRAALQELGLKNVFESFAALRPAVAIPEGARLANVFQRTTLSIDEQGTEGVSVTLGGGVIGGVAGHIPGEEPPKPFVMIVDRPFVFAIQHNATGQLLFVGAIVEP